MGAHSELNNLSGCHRPTGQIPEKGTAEERDFRHACGIPCGHATLAQAEVNAEWLRGHGYPHARAVEGSCDQQDSGDDWNDDD